MLKLSIKEKKQWQSPKANLPPKVLVLAAHKNKLMRSINFQKLSLLKQIGMILSFVRALRLVLKQNQWSTDDCEFLLQNLWSLQEQLSLLPCKLQNKALFEEANSYRKEALTSVANAIAALHSTNSKKIEFSLNLIIEKLELLAQVLPEKLNQPMTVKLNSLNEATTEQGIYVKAK